MPNRLAQETSPYLQQHADNPVDWYPWGEEALALAKREDKPILLSVGYSACHWCHVMAHESFEDAETAALMNRLYVNIKVDREERPDLDQIYQLAHQMLTQRSGGWPLTMFLTPEGAPFFGGTYFPKSPRFGLPGFGQLLERVERAYREQREAIEEQNRSLSGALARTVASDRAHHSEFDLDAAERMRELLASNFDAEDGGFGGAPKFPHPTDLEFLLRRFQARGDTGARDMALHTLRKMAEGGIYDQLGGGFCRYSVDAHWNIPHFEKMLYDNGPLLRLCADAWAISGDPLFRKVAEETAAWVMREMQAPEGGYYSSLDADSEHEEGKFYVWHRHEVETLLTPEQYAVAVRHYGLDRSPNFEGKDWHLHVARPLAEVAMALRKDLGECERLLTEARARLWEARERRVRPGRDEKILTSWNALTIDGMAHAAAVFGRSDWLGSARRALDFVRGTLWRDGRLLATYKDGRAHLNAYLDDHAFLLNALLELAQADFRADELGFAEDLAEALLERFEDREGGGFFFTSHDHERLIHRAKPGHDNATPSGNALAAFGLQRLGHLTGEVRYLEAAERALSLFYPQFSRHPAGYASFLACLEEHQHAPAVVVLRGPEDAARGWLAELRKAYRPTTIALLVGRAEAGLPPALDKPAGDRVNAWICSGVTCLPPVEDLAEVERVLSSGFVE